MGYTTIMYRYGRKDLIYVSDYSTRNAAINDFMTHMETMEKPDYEITQVITPYEREEEVEELTVHEDDSGLIRYLLEE